MQLSHQSQDNQPQYAEDGQSVTITVPGLWKDLFRQKKPIQCTVAPLPRGSGNRLQERVRQEMEKVAGRIGVDPTNQDQINDIVSCCLGLPLHVERHARKSATGKGRQRSSTRGGIAFMTWFIRLVPVLMSEIASEVLLSWNEGGADGLPLPILPRTCLRLGDRTNIQILVMAGALAVKQPWDGVIDATATPKNLSPSATALIRNWWYATDDIKDDTE